MTFRGERVVPRKPDRDKAVAQSDAGSGLSFRHELKFYINYRDYMLLKARSKAAWSWTATPAAMATTAAQPVLRM